MSIHHAIAIHLFDNQPFFIFFKALLQILHIALSLQSRNKTQTFGLTLLRIVLL